MGITRLVHLVAAIQLGERLASLATVGTVPGLGSGLILIVALLGMLASLA